MWKWLLFSWKLEKLQNLIVKGSLKIQALLLLFFYFYCKQGTQRTPLPPHLGVSVDLPLFLGLLIILEYPSLLFLISF